MPGNLEVVKFSCVTRKGELGEGAGVVHYQQLYMVSKVHSITGTNDFL